MSQFSYRGSPNLQCPAVTVSGSSLTSSSPSPVATVKSLLSGNASASAGSGSSSGSAIHQLSGVQQQQPQQTSRMAVTSGVVRPAPGSPSSSVSPSQPGHGVTATATSSGGGPPGGRCCDTGRPLFTDPISGQTVCSCQYDIIGGYQRLGGLPPSALSMYSAPYAAAAAAAASEGITAYFPSLGAEQPPFYTSTAAGLEGLKDNLGAGAAAGWPYPSVYHPYDAAFASYPFNGYGMDLNGARRKNATRETTSTLKAWLNEHKKNPYPTKGEKIMLAIITKMTLTQVSTWFANARRRLKKENKMTWEPRNRVEDEDNNNEDDDSGRKSVDDKDRLDSKDSGTGSSEDGERPAHRLDLLHAGSGGAGILQGRAESEWSESRADSGPDSPECLYDQREPRHPLHLQHHHHQHSHHPAPPPPPPSHHHHHHHHHNAQQQHQHPAFLGGSHARLLRHPSSPDGNSPHGTIGPVLGVTSHHATTIGGIGASSASTTGSQPTKPRIWSLADMASKDGEHHTTNVAALSGLTSVYANAGGATGGGGGGGGGASVGGGKIVSPLASRLQPHHPLHPAMHTGAQFVRPHPDFYRNFYGATHLSAGADMSLLETYSRTLGGLGGVIAPSGAPPPGILTSSTMASSVAAAAAAAAAAASAAASAASSGSSSSTSSLATSSVKAFAINGNATLNNANASSTGGPGVLLTTVSSGISPSSSSTASSGTSEQSPHPTGTHPPSELKSPGRV